MKPKIANRLTFCAIGIIGFLVLFKMLMKTESLCACGHPAGSAFNINHRTLGELHTALSERIPLGSSLEKLSENLWLHQIHMSQTEPPSSEEFAHAKALYGRYCSQKDKAISCQIDLEKDLFSLRKRGYAFVFKLDHRDLVKEIVVEKTERFEL